MFKLKWNLYSKYIFFKCLPEVFPTFVAGKRIALDRNLTGDMLSDGGVTIDASGVTGWSGRDCILPSEGTMEESIPKSSLIWTLTSWANENFEL